MADLPLMRPVRRIVADLVETVTEEWQLGDLPLMRPVRRIVADLVDTVTEE